MVPLHQRILATIACHSGSPGLSGRCGAARRYNRDLCTPMTMNLRNTNIGRGEAISVSSLTRRKMETSLDLSIAIVFTSKYKLYLFLCQNDLGDISEI